MIEFLEQSVSILQINDNLVYTFFGFNFLSYEFQKKIIDYYSKKIQLKDPPNILILLSKGDNSENIIKLFGHQFNKLNFKLRNLSTQMKTDNLKSTKQVNN